MDILASKVRFYEACECYIGMPDALGELALMFCFLAVALFNTFNAGTIVDGGPPPPFWIVLIMNPLLCIYGLVNNKN
tara:strand:- start:506 stop:736 length:231 start_codon:yes stop_codon:yes gene_type:complete